MNKLEKKLQSDILKAIRKLPKVWAKAHVATMYTGKGHPDVYGVISGEFFAAEIKRSDDEKPSRLQQETLKDVVAAGGRAFVWRSVKEAVSQLQNRLYCSAKDCPDKGKPLTAAMFSKNSRRPNGYENYCRDCKKRRAQKSYEKYQKIREAEKERIFKKIQAEAKRIHDKYGPRRAMCYVVQKNVNRDEKLKSELIGLSIEYQQEIQDHVEKINDYDRLAVFDEVGDNVEKED